MLIMPKAKGLTRTTESPAWEKRSSLSILTPSYNRGHLLPRLFSSLKDIPFIEQWIIIDDGSTDDTRKVVESFKEVSPEHLKILYIRQNNRGMTGALNVGIPYLTSDYFCKIDSDDYLTNEFERSFMEMFTSLQERKEEDGYHIFSLSCIDAKGESINSVSKNLSEHKTIKNAYIVEYARDRLYYQNLSGDLLDIFKVAPAKNLFRYPYIRSFGYCPSGILHMFYVIYFKGRRQFFYNKAGLHKDYQKLGITNTNQDSLSRSPFYYLISATMELALPNHSASSAFRSTKTFIWASLLILRGTFLHMLRSLQED